MKLVLLALLVFAPLATAFVPSTISYGVLKDPLEFSAGDGKKVFSEALTEVGMITVSDIPGFKELRHQVLTGAHRCGQVSPATREHVFQDRTVRRTLAAATDAGGDRELEWGEVAACKDFRNVAGTFRGLIGEVSHAFAARLDSIVDLGRDPIFLSSDGSMAYETVEDIFKYGEHLEHVHSYYLPPEHQGPNATTMDLHTDQGLCVAFTPALMVKGGEGAAALRVPTATGKFEVQLRSGVRAAVELSDDELVFMLGDGVHRYINPGITFGPELRAAPHAMSMPPHAQDEWRVWYGRMFMPPKDAVEADQDMTHGDLRAELEQAWLSEDDEPMERSGRLSMGCSGSMHAHEFRRLDDIPDCSTGARRRCHGNCGSNQLQCWWRCMNFTDTISPEACAAQDMSLQCTNLRDEISHGGVHHGSYSLSCTDSTQAVQPNCNLTQINADKPTSCSAAGFESFLAEQGTYSGRHDLLFDADFQPEVTFHWNVVGEKLQGMMAYNGKLSWISWGFENVGGGKNGMQGGKVLMGISAHDTEYPTLSGTVGEYKIDDSQSSFSAWNIEYENSSTTNTEMIEVDCYTAMKFETASIYGKQLDFAAGAQQRMMWALRQSTYMNIGKETYHEGCYPTGEGTDEARVRYRGGGEDAPWMIDFTDTAHKEIRNNQDEDYWNQNSATTQPEGEGLDGSENTRAAVCVLTLMAVVSGMLAN